MHSTLQVDRAFCRVLNIPSSWPSFGLSILFHLSGMYFSLYSLGNYPSIFGYPNIPTQVIPSLIFLFRYKSSCTLHRVPSHPRVPKLFLALSISSVRQRPLRTGPAIDLSLSFRCLAHPEPGKSMHWVEFC